MQNALSYIVFTDFDGTISVKDIGDALLSRFGNSELCRDVFNLYRTGNISAQECWRRGYSSVKRLTKEEVAAFSSTQCIDQTFKPFVQFCQSHHIPVRIVSDGFDAYIEPVLAKEGMEWLPRFSNSLQFNSDGSVEPMFPHTDAECSRCANCKRNHVVTTAGDDHVIVYVGDGYSDQCPAKYADVVFAKGSLVRFCETNNITFHRFESFADVLTIFRAMVEKRKLRKRSTAELARKAIFTME